METRISTGERKQQSTTTPTPEVKVNDPAGSLRRTLALGAVSLSRILILVVIMGIISLLSENFLTSTNLLNIFRQVVPQLVIALGMTAVLLTGGIDLSVGSTTTLSCVVLATLMNRAGISWPLAIVLTLCVGLAVGLVNGLLVTKAYLPSPLATYGMLWVGKGIAFAVMGVHPIFGFSDRFRFIGTGYLFGIPFQVIVALALIAVFALFLIYTVFGRSIYAVGSNYRAAVASGIKSDSILIRTYMICGLMASVAAVILLSRLNAVDQNAGESLLLPSVAAVVMGGTSMRGGEGGVLGTVIGSLIIVVITNGMNLLKVSSLWQQFVVGLTVIIAVWLDSFLKKKINA